ncbi:MAG: hypothetical protein QE271_11600 [Bacteriovoracaceae bacterium]|nr:hypothetical protein [Bacteriovoracaceae bacterium]
MKKLHYIFLLLFVFSFSAIAEYKAHFVCYGFGGGANVAEYQLGLMEFAQCHQLGWFSINQKPDVKLFINVKRSNYFALPAIFAKLDTFVMVFVTDANYVDLHGRYYGKNFQLNVAPIPFLPMLGPLFTFANYARQTEEENGTLTHQQISFYGLGAGLDIPIAFQESSIEIAYFR